MGQMTFRLWFGMPVGNPDPAGPPLQVHSLSGCSHWHGREGAAKAAKTAKLKAKIEANLKKGRK